MSTKVITGIVRFSYLNAFEPRASLNGGKDKYSVSLIIKKSDTQTIDAINKAIEEAYAEGQDKLKGTGKSVPPLSQIKTPLRDGDIDRPDDPAYAGCYFVNANSDNKPGIVDASCSPIIDRSECYSGCYGRASLNMYCYCVNGNRGIAAGLNNLQVVRQGEPLGGRSRAEDDFAGYTEDSSEDDILD